jgi:hypothetical protein
LAAVIVVVSGKSKALKFQLMNQRVTKHAFCPENAALR